MLDWLTADVTISRWMYGGLLIVCWLNAIAFILEVA